MNCPDTSRRYLGYHVEWKEGLATDVLSFGSGRARPQVGTASCSSLSSPSVLVSLSMLWNRCHA